MFRIFGLSFFVTIAALVAAFFYGGPEALLLTLILGILEVSLSFDNAVINATVLQRMSKFWVRMLGLTMTWYAPYPSTASVTSPM